MQLERTSAPASTLITLSEAKAHLRVDHTTEDTLITSLLSVADAAIDGRDGMLKRACITQTWRLRFGQWPAGARLYLPFPPPQSVTHVKYYDLAGSQQTYASPNYSVITAERTGYLQLIPSASWPALYDRADAVEIEFVAGYGNAAAVPAAIKHAALLIVGELYASRGDMPDDVGKIVPHGLSLQTLTQQTVDRLLRPYRIHQWSHPW